MYMTVIMKQIRKQLTAPPLWSDFLGDFTQKNTLTNNYFLQCFVYFPKRLSVKKGTKFNNFRKSKITKYTKSTIYIKIDILAQYLLFNKQTKSVFEENLIFFIKAVSFGKNRRKRTQY